MNRLKKNKGIVIVLIMVLLTGFLNVINAQQIKGKIVSGDDGLELPYANISLFRLPVNRVVTGGVSDISGKFDIAAEKGKYNVKIRVVGFAEKVISNVVVDEQDVILGEIVLVPSSIELGEVNVTAQRSFIETRPGKQILNVGREITGGGGNISQVLKLVPSVEVTPHGDVSIRGNENVKILINGKEMAYGLDPQVLLKQLPASTVDKIEVVTNASVSEDPESAGGAINIILKKHTNDGFHYGLNMEAGMKPFKGNAGFTANYAKGDFNTYLTYGAYVDNYDFLNKATRDFEPGNDFRRITDKGDGKYKDVGHLILAGIDYDLSDSVSLNFEFTHNRYNEDWEYSLNNEFVGSTETQRSFTKNENEDVIRFSDFSIRYENKINEKENLKGLFHYSGGSFDSERVILSEFDNISPAQTTNINTKSHFSVAELNLDYSKPLAKNTMVKAGINSEGVLFDVKQIISHGSLQRCDYDYYQHKQAVYLMASQKMGAFLLGLGIRPEYYKSETKELVGGTKTKQEYSSLFPNLQFEYQVKTNKIVKSLALTYAKRIRRPEYEEVDPVADYGNPTHTYQGNPDLKPEFVNSVELGYSVLKGSRRINANAFWRSTKDVIQQRTELLDNGNLYTTFLNFKNSNDIGLEFSAKYKPFKIWEFNLAGNYIYRWFAKNTQEENLANKEGHSWQLKTNNYFNLSPSNSIQVQFQFYGASQGVYYQRDAYSVLNLGFERKVMHGIGSLSISVNDVFNSGGLEYYKFKGDGFSSNSDWKLNSRFLKVSFGFFIN
jgi:ferric enterobactin receptor